MIITWMLGSIIVSALVALAAQAAEGAMHSLGRARRWPWLFALAAATVWPLIAGATFAVRAGKPTAEHAVTVHATSAVRAVAERIPSLGATWEGPVGRALVTLWAFASLALLIRLAAGLVRLRGVSAVGTPEDVDGMRVLVTESLGPAVYGAWKPRIVVPRWLFDLEPPLRSLVLTHEEQHRARGDAAVIVAGALATALVPWNPAVWWITRRMRLAVELDCDSRVVAAVGDTGRYSKLLLLIAQRQSHTTLVPMLAESNAHLGRRIAAMNGPRKSRSYVRAAAFGVVTVGVVALACSSPVMSDVTAPTPMSANKLSGLPQGDKVFFEFQVQQPVTQAATSVRPRYPDILKTAGVEGEVLAQFVVDTTGTPMAGSLKILKSTHALFTQAVRSAFPGMRFTAAEVNGRKVRQLVQEPFVFALAAPAASSRAPSRASVLRGDTLVLKGGVLTLDTMHVTPGAKRP